MFLTSHLMIIFVVLSKLEKKVLAFKFYVITNPCVCNGIFKIFETANEGDENVDPNERPGQKMR